MNIPSIIHHGGETEVTGSCHELFWSREHSILIDCGLFQGLSAEAHSPEIEFSISAVTALVLTHAHIDHVGRIPYLLSAGFRGPIYCSEPTAALLPIVLADAFSIGISRSKSMKREYLELLETLITPLPYREWRLIGEYGGNSLRIRLQEAGHILGSAYIECSVIASGKEMKKIIFSGDLGAPYTPLLKAPKPTWGCDTLILESTYGDRNHSGRKERKELLGRIIRKAAENRGVILIPAFSIGRTQELLYELEDLIFHESIDFEIILDSPLASRFTESFRTLQPFWDNEAKRRLRSGRHPLSFEELYCIESHEAHMQTVSYLKKTARPTVVIAASGMCTGGRIVNYLKALIEDSRTDILFVGYQATGTPGRAIQKYGPDDGWVRLESKKYTIKAAVWSLSGYSAHADQHDLLNFVRRMRKRPKEIQLVHGEDESRKALADLLEEEFPGMSIKG